MLLQALRYTEIVAQQEIDLIQKSHREMLEEWEHELDIPEIPEDLPEEIAEILQGVVTDLLNPFEDLEENGFRTLPVEEDLGRFLAKLPNGEFILYIQLEKEDEFECAGAVDWDPENFCYDDVIQLGSLLEARLN